jgi:hypothetical protein
MLRNFVARRLGISSYRQSLGDYMDRYVLKFGSRCIRLHHIRRADEDPNFHDHPWKFVSIGLLGSYTEERPTENFESSTATQMFPGRFIYRQAAMPHRISKVNGRFGCWTLVITGKYEQGWAFYFRDTGWRVPWRQYTDARDESIDVEQYKEYVSMYYRQTFID